MAGKMEEIYFTEKRDAAIEQAQTCVQLAEKAAALMTATHYQLPDLVSSYTVHEMLKTLAESADLVRYQYEKARWAATVTALSFKDWLQQHSCADLIRFGT